MNKHTVAFVALVLNLSSGWYFYTSQPHWSGASFACALWCIVDLARFAREARQREKLSTTSLNYKYGWADGWNSCRSAKPEERTFKRADVIV